MTNDASLSVEAQLAVINTKLDTLLVQRDDHETRIRKLEQFSWKIAGVIGLLSSGIGASLVKVLGG